VPQFEHRQRADGIAIKNTDGDFRKIVKIPNFGTLGGSPDFLCNDFLEGETGNGNWSEFQQIEIIEGDLRHRADGKNGLFAHADLQLDLHAPLVLRMRADGIGGAAVVGKVPVLLAVEPE
jgi:hypothetical protein